MIFKLPWAEDKPEYYDPMTGLPLPKRLDEQHEAALQAAVELAHALETLETNPGWKIIRAAMENDASAAHKTLLDSKSIEEVYQLQQFVKSRRSLISWIDDRIQASKTLLEETKTNQARHVGQPKGDK